MRQAKLVKAYAVTSNPTKAEIEAQPVTQAEILAHMPNSATAAEALRATAAGEAAIINADANAARAESEATTIPGAAPGAPAVSRTPALIESIGIGGTQALIQVLQQVAAGVIPRAQGIATIKLLFGITEAEAASMVPEQGTAAPVEGASEIPSAT